MSSWIDRPIVVRREEGGVDFKQLVDFYSEPHEIGLLEAHADCRPKKERIHMRFSSARHGTCIFSHVVRSADDFVKTLSLNTTGFRRGGRFVPVQDVVSVYKLDDRVIFALRDNAQFQIELMNDYTRAHVEGGDDITLGGVVNKWSQVYDFSKLRDVVDLFEIRLEGFLQDDDQALEVIPLPAEEKEILHYVPDVVVYKPIKRTAFNKLPIHYKLHCEEGGGYTCSQATAILHIRKQQDSYDDEHTGGEQ